MSYGAISVPAVRALSNGAAMAGCWLNTGEGGLSPYHLEGGCDLVFQIGTAKFGVRDPHGRLSDDRLREVASHPQVKMFELKLSQGAKPGKGGILPGIKVTPEIARIRGVPERRDAISPNRHVEIRTAGDLLDLIGRVRGVTGKPVGFKCVIGAYGWLDELFDEINRRGIESAPDFITVDSADGGSGAAPMSLMDYMGLPIQESLPIVTDMLQRHGLRERVKVIASGKLITPANAAWALAVGADFVVSSRGFMFALGCIQVLQCNRNTCPTGITTHNPKLQRGLDPQDKAVRVANYVRNMVYEVGVIAHACGVREPRELKRFHARIVQPDGKSVPLDELYPYVESDTTSD
jgi:glutamate synthase domain-containing protein 2